MLSATICARAAPARRAFAMLACLLVWALSAYPALAQIDRTSDGNTFPDFPVANGHYFSQAAGDDPAKGYSITNDGGIAFWDAFQRLGGVDAVGFPSTGRFTWMGFTDQATQKLILQWNPSGAQADVVNTFDVMEQLGLDPQLLAKRQTPPVFDNSADKGLSWTQIVARHQAELDWNAAIRARYFFDSNPIAHFGLPQSYGDEGNVLVIRCQRAVFQQWKIDVPWAHAGEVTIANGGDIAKEFGILPAGAAAPVAASDLIVAPFTGTLTLTPEQQAAVRTAAATLRPSLVAIPKVFADGQVGYASGMVIDPNGYILTDAHVVVGLTSTPVLLADGRTFTAQVIGRDVLTDIAVLHIATSGLTAVVAGTSEGLQPGALLVSLGYSDYFPSPPALRVGRVIGIEYNHYSAAAVNDIVDDLATLYGDSGAPVVDLHGKAVGIVYRLLILGAQGGTVFLSIENAFEGVMPIARQIIDTGQSIVRTVTGFTDLQMTTEIAKQTGIPFVPGVLVVSVSQGSSAAQAGIRPGDIITAIDGSSASVPGTVAAVLGRHKPGDVISLSFVDPQGSHHTASITLTGE